MKQNGPVKIIRFWKGMSERIPDLAKIALEFVFVSVNSVDAERSFSVYKNVVSDKCHNLSDRSTAILVGWYYNTCNGPDTICSDSEESEREDI